MRVKVRKVFTCLRIEISDDTLWTGETYRKFRSHNKRRISDHVVGYLPSQEELRSMDLAKRGFLSLLYVHKYGDY